MPAFAGVMISVFWRGVHVGFLCYFGAFYGSGAVRKPHLLGTAPTVYSFGENSLALT